MSTTSRPHQPEPKEIHRPIPPDPEMIRRGTTLKRSARIVFGLLLVIYIMPTKPSFADARAAAYWHADEGRCPLPIPYKKKGPVTEEWQTLRITRENVPKYFNGARQNIGVKLGVPYNLTDADLDAPDATQAWAEFGPETGFAFGHKSKPASHFFYYADPPIKLRQYKDPTARKSGAGEGEADEKGMLLEIRCRKKDGGIGLQTVVPPSIHPSGEPIEFVRGSTGLITTVDGRELVRAAEYTAACVLLGKYAPPLHGGRHDYFLAVAGALAHGRWAVADAIKVLRAVYRVLWKDKADLAQAARDVESTYQRHDDGHEITGLPHLKEVLDQRVFKAVVEWLGLSGRPGPKDEDVPHTSQAVPPSADTEAPFGEFDLAQWFAAHNIQPGNPLPYEPGKRMWRFMCPICGHDQGALLEMHNGALVYSCDGCGRSGFAEFQARVEAASQSVDEWDDAIPLRPWVLPSIEPEWIPGVLGDMCVAVAKATETPLELAVLVGAPVVSCCLAGKVEVEVETGYIEPVSLYCIAALESGARKTAVFDYMRHPLMEYESRERRRLDPAIKAATNKRKTGEERIAWLRRKAARSPLNATVLNQIADEEASLPEIPHAPQLWTQDVTPEKLARLLQRNRERMGIFSDEGGFFDLIGGRYTKGKPHMDIFLQGYSGSPVKVDRVSHQDDPIFLDHPLLSIALSPQPSVLQGLRDTPAFRERGLLGRFWYCLPASTLGYRKLTLQPVPDGVLRAYQEMIVGLILLTPTSVDDVWQAWRLKLSQGAYAAWKQFQVDIEAMMRDGGKLEQLKDWGSKLPGGVVRLAGVFHAVVVDVSRTDAEISRDTMDYAIKVATALIEHTRACFDLMERDPKVDDAQKILAWLRRSRRKTFTARECFCALQGRFKEMAAIRPVLALLVEHEYLRALPKVKNQGRGRPSSELFVANPRWECG